METCVALACLFTENLSSMKKINFIIDNQKSKEIKPSAIFLSIVLVLAAVSCGKEKDNSHVPSGRVAHMTLTQHTPDTAYRLEYTFAWQDTLLECVKCLLPDGRTERMECRYFGTRLTETAVYTADGTMRERWTYTYSDGKLARQTLTMQGGTTDCTFAYDGTLQHAVVLEF